MRKIFFTLFDNRSVTVKIHKNKGGMRVLLMTLVQSLVGVACCFDLEKETLQEPCLPPSRSVNEYQANTGEI